MLMAAFGLAGCAKNSSAPATNESHVRSAKVAKATSHKAAKTDKTAKDEAEAIFKNANLIEYKIDGLTTVCPKLEYNKPIESPIPSLSKEEMKDIIFKV